MDSNNNFDSFLIKKFLKEETEFLEEQGFDWEEFGRNKWCWLFNDEKINEKMMKKYFLSVLLPFYLIKKNLSRNDLKKLGFNPFLIRLSHDNILYEKLKENYIDYKKEDLIRFFGEKNASIKLKRAREKINDIEKIKNQNEFNMFSDIKTFSDKITDLDKNTLNNKQKFKYMLSRMYKYDSDFYEGLEEEKITLEEICKRFLIHFIKNRYKQKYIAEILNIDKRNLYGVLKKYINKNFNESKLEYFSKPIIIKHYINGLMAFEMIKIIDTYNYNETENKFGFSKNTIVKHIKEIWKEEFLKFNKNFSMLNLYLRYKYKENTIKTKTELKYEILQNSITKDEYIGINYLSFETRIIRYVQMFGFSVYDGYDLHKHLIEGNKASFHHLDFKKINDNIHNLIFMPDKPKEVAVDYIYHHHPIVRTREFYDIALHNINLLEKISKKNDISYAYSLKNWNSESIELLKNRLLNDDWIDEIYMFLPKGNFPYKLKNQTLEHFFKRFVHQNFYYRLEIIKTDFEKFWREYLDYRKELRDKSSLIVEIEDNLSLFLNNVELCKDNKNNRCFCKKRKV